MKRPKTKQDLTEIDEIRLVVLRARRRAQRSLRDLQKLAKLRKLEPAFRARLHRNIGFFETCIALTKPSWVAKASMDELTSALKHLCRDNTN